MKKLILINLFLFPIFSFASNCTVANTQGYYALESTMTRASTIGIERLNYGFNGRLTLNTNGTVLFNSTDSTEQNGIYGSGGTWSIAPGTCKITIIDLDFYNLSGGAIVGAPIVTDIDFWADPSRTIDDGINKIATEFVVRAERRNMESTNLFTQTINTDYYGRFRLYKLVY